VRDRCDRVAVHGIRLGGRAADRFTGTATTGAAATHAVHRRLVHPAVHLAKRSAVGESVMRAGAVGLRAVVRSRGGADQHRLPGLPDRQDERVLLQARHPGQPERPSHLLQRLQAERADRRQIDLSRFDRGAPGERDRKILEGSGADDRVGWHYGR